VPDVHLPAMPHVGAAAHDAARAAVEYEEYWGYPAGPAPALAPAAAEQAPARVPAPVARIAGVAVHLPDETRDVAEAERALHRRNPKVAPRAPLMTRLTGVRTVHVAPNHEQASDLAVHAARKVLDDAGLTPADLDLLIFASATQDMIEPATSHITCAKLGATCPVMDVKNACNSVLNGIEVAESLIGTGRYRRVLVAGGEMPTRGVRWDVPDRATYALSAPGYTMSDAGAAVLVVAAGQDAGQSAGPAPFEGDLAAELAELTTPRGILASSFSAASEHWDVGMLPGGGTVNPRDPERTYFEIDGSRLRDAFLAFGPAVVDDALARAGLTWDDVGFVAVHQVAVGYLDDVYRVLGVPRDRTLVTVADHGNVASATLPLQLALAQEQGRLRPGDVAVLVGLAGGISMGATVVRW
jgi:acyl-CoA:acyl-CoA alkyltransferase